MIEWKFYFCYISLHKYYPPPLDTGITVLYKPMTYLLGNVLGSLNIWCVMLCAVVLAFILVLHTCFLTEIVIRSLYMHRTFLQVARTRLCPSIWSQVQFMTVIWGFSDPPVCSLGLSRLILLSASRQCGPSVRAPSPGSTSTPAGGYWRCPSGKACIPIQIT